MQITNEAADIIHRILSDNTCESISTIEDSVQLNKEFNNQFDINTYFNWFNEQYCLWETLYESILLWWFKYFKDKVQSYNMILQYWYYDYLYRYDKWELQEAIDLLTTKESIQLMDDPICNYYIHKFSLDIKI